MAMGEDEYIDGDGGKDTANYAIYYITIWHIFF